MQTSDVAYRKGLPASLDAERLVLGAILLNGDSFISVAGSVVPDDFSLEKHRRIFGAMTELHERAVKIDRVTVAEELMRRGELESCDGLSYLISLDDGLPTFHNLDAYIRILKDKSALRRIIYSAQLLIDKAFLGEHSPDELLAEAEESMMQLGESRTSDALLNPGQIIEQYQGGLNAFLDTSQRIRGISTGFERFDEMTGGLREGELFILAARPSMGKTALALNMAQHVACAREPRTVAVFSLEMSKESLLTRMICAAARVDQQRFRVGYLNDDERWRLQKAASELFDAPLFIDDTAGANIMDIHAKLRKLQQQHGLGLVVIDYLQLMSGRGRFENRNLEVSSISRGLKLMAKDLRVPFIVLSQLSRAPETRPGDHRPQLSDLRESGSIEQDADLVGFIFREEVYKPDNMELKGLAELILAKQRNGPTGRINLAFLREFTKFENLARDIESSE